MKSMLGCVVALASLAAGAAETLYWTETASAWGAEGAWTNAAGLAKTPAKGDTLWIRCAGEAGGAVENDLEGLSIKELHVEGLAPVRVFGKPITLTGDAFAHTIVTNDLDITLGTSVNQYVYVRTNEFTKGLFGTLYYVNNGTVQGTTKKTFLVSATKANGGRTTQRSIYLNGDVILPNANLEFALHGPCRADVNGRVEVAKYDSGRAAGDNGSVYWNGSNNSIPYFLSQYKTMAAGADNCFGTNAVLRCGRWESSGSGYDLKTYDQLIDRVSVHDTTSYRTPLSNAGEKGHEIVSTGPVTLTMRGTASATMDARLQNQITVVWDPVEPFEFVAGSNRVHQTTGDIIVSNGTFRVHGQTSFTNVPHIVVAPGATFVWDSTAALGLRKVTRVTVGANGTFALGEGAAQPFAENVTVVTLAEGARLSVPEGQTLAVGILEYAGEAAAAKTHDTADWLTGGGSVTVSGTVTTPVWKRAVDGNWADAANWYGPAPTAGCVPDVAAPGSFVITFKGTDPTPGALTLGGVGCQVTLRLSGEVSWTSGTFDVSHGGTIEVPSGTSLFCKDNPAFTVSGGGAFLVSGGDVTVTNLLTTFGIQGGSVQTGRLSVTSGKFLMYPYSTQDKYRINVLKGGLVDVSGGEFRLVPISTNTGYPAIVLGGGRIAVGGEAVFGTGDTSTGLIFSSGDVVFSGHAVLNSIHGSTKLQIKAEKDKVTTVSFRDFARMTGKRFDNVTVGRGGDGEGVLNLDSDPTANGQTTSSYFGYRLLVGTHDGRGTVNQTKGYWAFNSRGLVVGGSGGSKYNTESDAKLVGGKGLYRMSGGTLLLDCHSSVGEGLIPGLTVGDGTVVATALREDCLPYEGAFELSGGVITNESGALMIGGPRGIGRWNQTGGTYRHTSETLPAMVGVAGGKGTFAVSGGEVALANDLYVGGVPTNAIAGYASDDSFVRWGWPVERHDAVGTLTVAGGTVALAAGKSCHVGVDGAGALAVVGSKGTFDVGGDLVLSNTVAAATSSTLTFALDESGISPIRVGGKIVNAPGTKVRIDLGPNFRQLKRVWLLKGRTEGAAFENDAEIVGEGSDEAVLKTRPDGLVCHIPGGVLLLVR